MSFRRIVESPPRSAGDSHVSRRLVRPTFEIARFWGPDGGEVFDVDVSRDSEGAPNPNFVIACTLMLKEYQSWANCSSEGSAWKAYRRAHP